MEKMKKRKMILLEISLFIILIVLLIVGIFQNEFISAGVSENNVTVQTLLTIGNSYPEILNVSVEDGASSVSLSPNANVSVKCVAVVRDWEGQDDIGLVSARLYDSVNSNWSATDDKNHHYTNNSCNITTSFGTYNGYADDTYSVLINCTFDVSYNANPETWNCTIVVNDTLNLNDTNTDQVTINELLAVGLPDTIDYGTVNATEVSLEKIANVTNYGNVRINLSLSGYGTNISDGNAMNCTLGNVKNISIEYEKYNLTSSNDSVLSLAQFDSIYKNLSSNVVVNQFNLNYRQDESTNEAVNSTYWRIYVPTGVAGTCRGNIVFGGVKSAAT